MEARYATRKQPLLAECQVAPEIFEQVLPRLTTFMAPFVETFCRPELDQHAHTYICGLLSEVERKNIESIAYRFGQDRLPLQRFIGWAPWDDVPLRQELTRQVAEHLGQAEGVLVFDPSGFPKSGTESAGWRASGVAVWARSTTVKSPSTWATCRARAIPWSTCGCICPKNGLQTRPAWTKPVCPTPIEGIARGTSWHWTCCRPGARSCRMGGSLAMTRWGVRIGFVAGLIVWASAICWRCRAIP